MLTDENPSKSSLTRQYLALASGLTVAGIAGVSYSVPLRHSLSWPQLLGMAVQRVFVISLACAVTVAAISGVHSRWNKLESDRLVIQMSLAAVWLAPLSLLIREHSLWTLPVSAIFTLAVVPSLFSSRNEPAGGILAEDDLLSFFFDDAQLNHARILSVIAALCVEFAALTAVGGYTLIGSLLVAVGIFIWGRRWADISCVQDGDSSKPNGHFHTFFIAGIAIAIMVAALIPFLRGGRGFARSAATMRWAAYSAGQRQLPLHVTTMDDDRNSSDGNSGIVLWPEKQVETRLVVPVPFRESVSLENVRNPDPLVIPFNGVYWFFKFPDRRPPTSSRQAHVSPDKVEIRSTDHRPLSIEAHDHFGQLIDLSCCSRIQIAIRNADRYPETVSLELILVNTTLPNRPSESLGIVMVRSTHPWSLYEKAAPVSETLNFAIPFNRSFRQFDEARIVFQLDRARADLGTKIAIDHFVLVPRGL